MSEISQPSAARRLPSVDAVLGDPHLAPVLACWGRPLVLAMIRLLQGEARSTRQPPAWALTTDGYAAPTAERLAVSAGRPQQPVINLTGTLIHTNLGRAPLPEAAVAAMADNGRGATNLEFDLVAGRRGKRESFVASQLNALTDAQASTFVNNGAAGLVLILNTLALGREVPVSRGELIEIGGSFRLPDIMERAGCRLREVGTTNRTHPRDYENAVSSDTAMLLKVHPSNYRVSGFTASVDLRALADIGSRHSVPVVEDLGAGALVDYARFGLPHEPTPMESLSQGADLVLFSGDKLLGGPQAGIIVGRADLIAQLDANPLKRALRLDRAALAALSATLSIYADADRIDTEIPVVRMAARPVEDVRAAAVALAAALGGKPALDVTVVDSTCEVGSGALPGATLPSAAVCLRAADTPARDLLAALRALTPPLIGRISDGAVLLDCRTLLDPDAACQSVQALEITR